MAESDRRIVGACFALGAWLPGHHGDDSACADRRCRGSACGDRNLAHDPESAAADHRPLRASCIAPPLSAAGALPRPKGRQAMRRITRDDVTKAINGADEVTIAQMIGTGATVDELAEAQAWLANDEPMLNAGRPLATGRVRELVDILSELQPEDEEEVGPAAVTQE